MSWLRVLAKDSGQPLESNALLAITCCYIVISGPPLPSLSRTRTLFKTLFILSTAKQIEENKHNTLSIFFASRVSFFLSIPSSNKFPLFIIYLCCIIVVVVIIIKLLFNQIPDLSLSFKTQTCLS